MREEINIIASVVSCLIIWFLHSIFYPSKASEGIILAVVAFFGMFTMLTLTDIRENLIR